MDNREIWLEYLNEIKSQNPEKVHYLGSRYGVPKTKTSAWRAIFILADEIKNITGYSVKTSFIEPWERNTITVNDIPPGTPRERIRIIQDINSLIAGPLQCRLTTDNKSIIWTKSKKGTYFAKCSVMTL